MTKRILIADDDDDLRQALAQLLELEGFTIAGAPDSGAALGLVQAQAGYDLILLDATMPGANGLDVLAALRGLLPNVPIIVMSAQNGRNTASKALRGGASDFIVKPFEDEHVLQTVKKALGLQN
jgi:DNA-binding NtrC family response regulator